ncbi:MAG: response regulator [Spirochaetota bacterium]
MCIGTVLVVDDDRVVLEGLTKGLSLRGYNVTTVENGQKALALVKETSFDLVITDIVMDKIDGISVLKTIKELHPHCAVLILTGYGELTSAVDALRLDADDYILKPCNLEELFCRMERCFEKTALKKRLEQALKEKEILLRETHHRVKNNLAMIISIINLESGYMETEKDLFILEKLKYQIKSILLIHEKLYQGENLAAIDLKDYLEELLWNVIHSLTGSGVRIELSVDIPTGIRFDIETMIPVGLISTELVTNAVKHAFTGRENGKITVTLLPLNQRKYELTVCDNGSGFPETVDYLDSPSLGLKLIQALVQQLQGTFELTVEKGTCFTIGIPNI